jgi:proline iminopeptidase
MLSRHVRFLWSLHSRGVTILNRQQQSNQTEGYIPVTGGKVWYQIAGNGKRVPLLVLHGGPGFPHDYLESLRDLSDERPVIFYDQLGCGKSDRPDDVSLWRIERFVEELGQIRQALGLQHVHLFGHSWGTILAAEYLFTQPTGLQSVIFASPALSMPRWINDGLHYRTKLPKNVQAMLSQHEANATTASPEYQKATQIYDRYYVCRVYPMPEPLVRASQGMNYTIYQTMWGPAECYVPGSLKDYDRTSRLHELTLPTLFTCGRFDEATPETTAWYQSLVPHAEMVVFEQSAHMAHLEESQRYVEVLRDFLRRVETKGE